LSRLICGLAGLCIGAGARGAGGVAVVAPKMLPGTGAMVVRSSAGRVTTFYGGVMSEGRTPMESAQRFVGRFAGDLGVEVGDLRPGGLAGDGRHVRGLMPDSATGRDRFTLVCFAQERGGVPVDGGELRVLVRNEPGYPVVLARSSLRAVGGFKPVSGGMKAGAAEGAARAHAPGMVVAAATGPARRVIWAGTDKAPGAAREAIEVVADNGGAATPGYRRERLIVDAATGELLHRESLVVQDDVIGSVRAQVTQDAVAEDCALEMSAPLPYARVWISGVGAAIADASGNFVIPSGGTGLVTVWSDIRGAWFRVYNAAGAGEVLSLAVLPPGPANFLHNAPNMSSAARAQVNSYLHANVARDYALAYCPQFPVIGSEASFPINVNLALSCNAFYDGTSINFFAAGGGCANTGFGTVVHHEYGHHLVRLAGSGQGEYGEGMGDVMGVLITDEPVHARGFYGDCAAGSRTASNTCQYLPTGCSTCGSGIHACGQLLSGSVWSTRTALRETDPATYREVISALAINAMLLHTGSAIDPNITIDYLTLDDDDAFIFNGTPHFQQIAAGFGAHGLDAPERLPIDIRYPSGRPELVDPHGRTVLRFEVVPVTGQPQPGSAAVYVDSGSGFIPAPVREVAPNVYEATMPGGACGGAVRYYAVARAADGSEVPSPMGAPVQAFETVIASSVRRVFTDDCEADRGWTLGLPGDTAFSGQWVRDDPIGTIAQPEDDWTPDPGVACYFTGQGTPGGGPGQADVDFGNVTLLSPPIDLSGAAAARVSYWCWYSNSQGDAANEDTMLVQVSGDDGSSWTTVETIGPAGGDTSGGWLHREFDLGAGALGAATRIRFVVSDLGDPSLVEGAVDDVEVVEYRCGPRCRADWNLDGTVTSQDLFEFLDDFFQQSPVADFNGDGRLDSDDFFQFLSEFFVPCP
jgi:hypothetical protein